MAATDPSDERRWTRGERIVVVSGALLAADLLLLPWHHFSIGKEFAEFGVTLPTFTYNRTGVQNPQAFFGMSALLVSLAMVGQIFAAKVSAAVPRLEQAHLVAGPVVLGLVLAKLLANNNFLGPGAWAGSVLAAGVAYGGFLLSQESPAPETSTAPPG